MRGGGFASLPAGVEDAEWLVTPGIGVAVLTPFGPVRVDVAYNPSSTRRYPLLARDPETGDYRVLGTVTYDPFSDADAWRELRNRLQLQVTLGQVF